MNLSASRPLYRPDELARMPDLTVTGAATSGAQAYTMAGLKPRDIDVVMPGASLVTQ